MQGPLDQDLPSADDFRRIRELFESALDRPPKERGPFLDQACLGDEVLRHEVERMLAQSSSPAMVDRPAWHVFPDLLTEEAEPAAGAQFGPYRVEEGIGAGGMGRVYRATDTRLGRAVALKISRREFSERFEREARIVATLNHPNVCTLYDVGSNYLVMELVPGPTLAERIHHGPIPLPEALRIAREIGAALEAAHQKGIVHGDLKPGNIMLTESGQVKVLDFGLARNDEPGPTFADPWNSPRTSSERSTAGAIAGTPAYMSPEQAAGGRIDRRVDIWAFGSVLFEMVAGAPPFTGLTNRDVLAAISGGDAPIDRAPQEVRGLLRACLARDPARRPQDMGEAIRILNRLPVGTRTKRWLPWAMSAAMILAVVALALRPSNPDRPMLRMEISLPEGVTLRPAPGVGFTSRPLVLSPDGSALVFEAYSKDQTRMFWIRLLTSDKTYPLPRMEGTAPFWSPDSRWLAFFGRGKLQRIRITGGEPQDICRLEGFAGGTWNSSSTILIGNTRGPILRVSTDGGLPAPVLTLEATEIGQTDPSFLPDGRHFLYVSLDRSRSRRLMLASLDEKTRKPVLAPITSSPIYAPNPQGGIGWLLYVDAGRRVARPFEPAAGEFKGEARVIAQVSDVAGEISWSASTSGLLAFRRDVISQFTWFDREGNLSGVAGEPQAVSHFPRLSPDQKDVLFFRNEETNAEVWKLDVARNNPGRLTTEPAGAGSGNAYPIWSFNGTHVLYWSFGSGMNRIVERPADGSGPERSITTGVRMDPNAVSRDGRWLGVTVMNPDLREIALMSWPAGRLVPIPNPEAADRANVSISPNGRWLAYTWGFFGPNASPNPSPEVRVRSTPKEAGGLVKSIEINISGPGGANPIWSRDGKEIFYLASDGKLMAAPIKEDATSLVPFPPKVLFQSTLRPDVSRNFDVTADGQRFLVNRPMEPPFTVIVNWPQLLRK